MKKSFITSGPGTIKEVGFEVSIWIEEEDSLDLIIAKLSRIA